MSKRKILMSGIILVFSVLMSGCINKNLEDQKLNLKIFHAGSLAEPLSEIEKEFEAQCKNIDVQMEAAGSVQTINKVIQLNKSADVVFSADADLIQMMYPNYANWTIKFATNEIVLAYTNNSKYANEINSNNWYEILKRDGVKFGFSNPNNDPCGYRSIITIQLAEFKYNNNKIFDDIIEKNTNIRSECENENLTCMVVIPSSAQINPNPNKVMIRSLEIDLISALQNKEIDYFFIYRSVAVQNKFNFIELPAEINLKDEQNNKIYERVSIKFENGKIQKGRAIVYGVTIPKNAEHKKEAIEFVKFLISNKGNKIFNDLGHPSISPAIVDNIDNLPEELKEYVKVTI